MGTFFTVLTAFHVRRIEALVAIDGSGCGIVSVHVNVFNPGQKAVGPELILGQRLQLRVPIIDAELLPFGAIPVDQQGRTVTGAFNYVRRQS